MIYLEHDLSVYHLWVRELPVLNIIDIVVKYYYKHFVIPCGQLTGQRIQIWESSSLVGPEDMASLLYIWETGNPT